ncbi:hypothetical protein ASPWEDRAFT_26296 [Aspergillus wentii DTO 134E9]|uniref:Mid2 domain-containing protein n=1 Tax=Aspergillus wentii DTO 134E9 TaxID=1073089 RepID=A0A1L9RPH3_ASPWE|nr:uncharacterized protein ASPWEDRAFT_26296 [Aspergillus wentii DTO 134E9]OJJ36850.1 hypothetical protein ASPWEDRAFT_26296 [Aspergillus wentii DTO 134E9]
MLLLVLTLLAIVQISVAQDTATATDGATSATDATATDTTAATTAQTTDTSATSTDTSTTSSSTSSSSTSSSTTSYPVVTVPPTADAPYMQKSSTPEGTLFIAVGAVLGFIGLALLAWRGLVAWSVNRSVRQAALVHSSETKGLLRSKKRRSTVYSQRPPAPVSLEKMGSSNRTTYKPPAKAAKVPSSNSGLFFSPTAGAGMHGTGNRGSTYLPAGYYAASTAGQNAQYNSQGYTRTRTAPSPPGSPTLPPTGLYDTNYHNRQSSTSSLNLTSPPQGRAPSAYLEDLFESHAPKPDRNHR